MMLFSIVVELVFITFNYNFDVTDSSSCKCCECETKNLLVPQGYDKFKTPLEDANESTEVFVSLDIMDIDEIIEERMEYSMQFYVSEYWKDERLNATYFDKYDRFRIPRDWVPDIWVPDTIFENSKGGWIYPLSVPNVVIRIHSFKYLHRFTRYNMKVTCAMQLRNYPMDSQNCVLMIASCYPDAKMKMKWIHERQAENRGIQDSITVADLRPLKYYVANMTPVTRVFQYDGANYTSLHANFIFVRHISSHIMNVYVPSGLVVILAFLTFWLNVRSVPARVALGLTSLLTLSTQASQARSHLPPVNYLTALDIWLFACMFLVFSSLLEYATVYHLYNKKMRKLKLSSLKLDDSVKNWADSRGDGGPVFANRDVAENSENKKPLSAKKSNPFSKEQRPIQEFEEEPQFFDIISRLLFPAAFLLFSMVYWIHFLRTGTS